MSVYRNNRSIRAGYYLKQEKKKKKKLYFLKYRRYNFDLYVFALDGMKRKL